MARSTLAFLTALFLAVVLLAAAPAVSANDDRLDFTFPAKLGSPDQACKKVKAYCDTFKKSQMKGYVLDNVCETSKGSKQIKVVCESIKGSGKSRKVDNHISDVEKKFSLKAV